MFLSAFLAAAYTFSATATGVAKGTPVEFLFVGANTDRDYESMFLIDGSIDDFCAGLEKAGLPRGKPVDAGACRLWPVGCTLTFSPDPATYVDGKMPEGLPPGIPVYTGGTRLSNDVCAATQTMPSSVFSIYSLAQSPIVYNGIYNQGAVYGAFTARETLKKGERVTFTVSWDATTMPKSLRLVAKPGNGAEIIKTIRSAAEKGAVDVLVGFDGELTVEEATAMANALNMIDGPHIKINGYDTFFYRSFTPLVKWQDRKERLVQPFELTIGDPDKLVFVDEDWSGEGADPKLLPREIPFSEAARHAKTDTCFFYASKETKVSRLLEAKAKLAGSQVKNWYVFTR